MMVISYHLLQNLMVSCSLSRFVILVSTISHQTYCIISDLLYCTSVELVVVSYHIDTRYTLLSRIVLHTEIVRGWYQYGVHYWDGKPWFVLFVFNLDLFYEVAKLTDPNLHSLSAIWWIGTWLLNFHHLLHQLTGWTYEWMLMISLSLLK